jgi:transposase
MRGSALFDKGLRKQGHEVRHMPAQFVKPYRNSNKNDFLDAEATAEAVTKQNMRFVPIKTQERGLGYAPGLRRIGATAHSPDQ